MMPTGVGADSFQTTYEELKPAPAVVAKYCLSPSFQTTYEELKQMWPFVGIFIAFIVSRLPMRN